MVEDIQWAELTLLDLLAGLPSAIGTAPVLLLAPARPELLERRPDWPVTLELEPFGERDVGMLLDDLLGTAPAGVRRRLTSASGGNPLFVEELVAMLVDEGVLRVDGRGCVLAGDLDALDLPASLHALLGARLDGLEPVMRGTLERGAIEGEVFHRGAAVELSPPAERASVPASLDALTSRDLVRPAESQFAGEDALRFKHILVRDAAYRGTAKAPAPTCTSGSPTGSRLRRARGCSSTRRSSATTWSRVTATESRSARSTRRFAHSASVQLAVSPRRAAGRRAAPTSAQRAGCSGARPICCRPVIRSAPDRRPAR